MLYLTKENFQTTVDSTIKPLFILFAGRWSVLGNTLAAKLLALNLDKVSVYQVDIDSSEGAQIAMSFSIRESPFLILFETGVPKLKGSDLTNEMVQAVSK